MNRIILSKNERRERFFRYAPLILWIGVIFLFSSNQGSMTKTSSFVRPLLEFLFPGISEETLTIYHSYIRKTAHFVEYAVLGLWSSRAFWSSTIEILRRFWWLAAFILVFLTASADEYNQSFNPARTSSIYDVFIDLSGGLTMIIFLLLLKKVFIKS
ncbi:MAG TPA: VanZ family protein [Pyrinomonadaceae bacterium]|jgi:VanZ family protein